MSVAHPVTTYTDRVERLRAALHAQNLDAILVTNPENRRYLSGFTGHDSGADSAGALVITGDAVTLITDGRYIEQAATECPGLRVVKRDGQFASTAATAIAEAGIDRLGFEATHVTVALRDDLDAALAEKAGQGRVSLAATRNLIEPLRAVKDGDEIAAIERAVAITDETFTYLCGYLRPGLTEREVAHEIERYMREQGADGMAFAPIVASGPNAALPHAVPTERAIQLGEPITIDMGARYNGYCADMTRTVCLGEPGPEAQAIYDAVLRAQEACEAELAPGMSGKAADAAAREVLEASGYGEQFLHSTGHGLGLEIHEDPRLSKHATEEQKLEPGMAITIEPGVYVAGWGGVRIEDTAIVTADGIRVLTTSHKRFGLPR
ncbi:MAG TPA: Xaa-Pro peptidase family protein [Ktedonobacterales bacterium]|nr:Xaa-Pro peptidase family protein [Ktedonobacterales bacterium]